MSYVQGSGGHLFDFLVPQRKLGVVHLSIGLSRSIEFNLAMEFLGFGECCSEHR